MAPPQIKNHTHEYDYKGLNPAVTLYHSGVYSPSLSIVYSSRCACKYRKRACLALKLSFYMYMALYRRTLSLQLELSRAHTPPAMAPVSTCTCSCACKFRKRVWPALKVSFYMYMALYRRALSTQLKYNIPYSGKLWQALSLANQSSECISEF